MIGFLLLFSVLLLSPRSMVFADDDFDCNKFVRINCGRCFRVRVGMDINLNNGSYTGKVWCSRCTSGEVSQQFVSTTSQIGSQLFVDASSLCQGPRTPTNEIMALFVLFILAGTIILVIYYLRKRRHDRIIEMKLKRELMEKQRKKDAQIIAAAESPQKSKLGGSGTDLHKNALTSSKENIKAVAPVEVAIANNNIEIKDYQAAASQEIAGAIKNAQTTDQLKKAANNPKVDPEINNPNNSSVDNSQNQILVDNVSFEDYHSGTPAAKVVNSPERNSQRQPSLVQRKNI